MPNPDWTPEESAWAKQGADEHAAGVDRLFNPFALGTRAYACWQTGWLEADETGGNRGGTGLGNDAPTKHDRDYHGGQFHAGEW